MGAHVQHDAVLKHWKEGKKREDIEIKQIDKVINLGEFKHQRWTLAFKPY